jgi:hypothetical protein
MCMTTVNCEPYRPVPYRTVPYRTLPKVHDVGDVVAIRLTCHYPTNGTNENWSDAISSCTNWYLSLLQYRGARWFQGLAQLPGAEEQDKKRHHFRLPSPSNVLNAIQGPLSPVLALFLWAMLLAGHWRRAGYYNVLTALTGLFGLRSFIAIVANRAATIKHISAIQNKAPGTLVVKRRRMTTLKRKTLGIIVDLIAVFMATVLLAGSFVMAGSFFSSRQAIIHYAVGETLSALMVLGASLQMHGKLRMVRRKRKRVQDVQDGTRTIESQQSGLSVLEQSCFGGNGGTAGTQDSKSGGGLFSEAFSEV